jgi:hypothetical protein
LVGISQRAVGRDRGASAAAAAPLVRIRETAPHPAAIATGCQAVVSMVCGAAVRLPSPPTLCQRCLTTASPNARSWVSGRALSRNVQRSPLSREAETCICECRKRAREEVWAAITAVTSASASVVRLPGEVGCARRATATKARARRSRSRTATDDRGCIRRRASRDASHCSVTPAMSRLCMPGVTCAYRAETEPSMCPMRSSMRTFSVPRSSM